MKKFILMLALMLSILAFDAEAKKPKGEIVMEVISQTMNGEPFETDSVLRITFVPYADRFVTLMPYNRTNDKINIEWDGAKFDGAKLVFDTDSRLNMNQQKGDEAVYAGQSGLMRNVTSQYKVGDYSIYPIYEKKEVEKTGIPKEVSISITVRLKDDSVRLYKYTLKYYFKKTENQ